MKKLPATQSGELPRIIFVEQLAEIIGKTPSTIRTFATNSRYQHLIPPYFKMPFSRRLCWYENEVQRWIESNRQTDIPIPRRGRGRPTKAQQLQGASVQKMTAKKGGGK